MESENLEYVGFWARTGAAILDTILLILITAPLLLAIYGTDYYVSDQLIAGPADMLISWVFPAVAIIWFWVAKQATPGKMVISARLVDARTGQPVNTGQAIGRYLGYFLASLPLFLGLLWVAFDSRKQGWHDKLAGTVVVRPKARTRKSVVFE